MSREIDWHAVACAELHELRIAILGLAADRAEVSPLELATELGAPLGNTSYHVRQLVLGGMLELVRTEPRRGALAHFYRLTDAYTAVADDVPAEIRARLERLRSLGATATPRQRAGTWLIEVDTPWHDQPVLVRDDDDARYLLTELESRAA